MNTDDGKPGTEQDGPSRMPEVNTEPRTGPEGATGQPNRSEGAQTSWAGHDHLLAAITAREERARRALDVDLSGRWAIQSNRTQTPAELAAVADFWQGETNASAVLRQTTRDRRVIERHGPARRLGGVHEICAHDWADSDGWLSMWPCAEIADLAEAYGIDLAELPGDDS